MRCFAHVFKNPVKYTKEKCQDDPVFGIVHQDFSSIIEIV